MITCGSLFSGGGGWEVGAQAAGMQPLWAVELDPKIAQVHRDNFPESQVINRSVTAVSDEQIAYLPRVNVLFASPPCQAHSVNRSKKLVTRDDADVGIDVARWVRIQQPDHVFIENVRGYAKSEAFAALASGLEGLGYCVAYTVLDAGKCGVPQRRFRLVLHAVREGLPTLPQPSGELVTWYAAISDLIPNLPPAKLYPKYAAQLEQTTTPRLIDGQNTGKARDGSRRKPAYLPDRPSFTVVSSIWKGPPFYVCGEDVRRLTPRAIARLCSFPDSYRLPDDKKTAYMVLGNAVPPLLARRVAELVTL